MWNERARRLTIRRSCRLLGIVEDLNANEEARCSCGCDRHCRPEPAIENGIKYVLVSHNTKMGAAKGAVLVAEYLASSGYL
jgi:aspartate-semialdehyde dehydrogenase